MCGSEVARCVRASELIARERTRRDNRSAMQKRTEELLQARAKASECAETLHSAAEEQRKKEQGQEKLSDRKRRELERQAQVEKNLIIAMVRKERQRARKKKEEDEAKPPVPQKQQDYSKPVQWTKEKHLKMLHYSLSLAKILYQLDDGDGSTKGILDSHISKLTTALERRKENIIQLERRQQRKNWDEAVACQIEHLKDEYWESMFPQHVPELELERGRICTGCEGYCDLCRHNFHGRKRNW